jgi:hypothetical protein
MRIGWLVNADHFVTTSPFRNLPATQRACAEFQNFAEQRNGGGIREKYIIHQDGNWIRCPNSPMIDPSAASLEHGL